MDDTEFRPCPIIDCTEDGYEDSRLTRENTKPLPEQFGRNLDTLEKARLWLTNPHNWHTSKLFILKWSGLLCTVNEEYGRRLVDEPGDDGLPWCVVHGQKQRRMRGEAGEPMEEPEAIPLEEES